MNLPDEPAEINNRTLQWGAVANLIDKISDIENSIDGGWDELVEMVSDAIVRTEYDEDMTRVFVLLFQYLYRLLFRLKRQPIRRRFDLIEETTDSVAIINYSYTAYKWAKENKLIKSITDDRLELLGDKLTNKQLSGLKARARKDKDDIKKTFTRDDM